MLSIRTQDRMVLVPYNAHIVIRKRTSKHSIEIETFYSTVVLGTYATQERALKVLDEIAQALCSNENIYVDINTREPMQTIFQMPKE